jgi:S-(hydroxymethyl)glutathione dehydrogenase/alcohol dehydrogenase
MKAAILVEQKKPLVIDEVELPKELKVGQVLVKVQYSGICGSQLGEIDGVKGSNPYLPHLLGHEGSGTVLDVGPGIRHVKPKDKVVLHWRKGIGIESDPPIYKWKGAKLNAGWVTTFNEYAIVSENRCTAIPHSSELDVAALFGCAVTTGFGVVENNAKIRIGESVVIYGAGGIGLNIVQAAALVSAYPIIAIDQYDIRLKLASEMGATYIINSKKEDVLEKIFRILNSDRVDVFIDNTGLPSIIEMGYKITKDRGRLVLVGVPKKENNIRIFSLPLHFGKSISGSHGGDGNPYFDIPRYYNLYQNGKIKLKNLISNIIQIENINKAIEDMRSGDMKGRCLIEL